MVNDFTRCAVIVLWVGRLCTILMYFNVLLRQLARCGRCTLQAPMYSGALGMTHGTERLRRFLKHRSRGPRSYANRPSDTFVPSVPSPLLINSPAEISFAYAILSSIVSDHHLLAKANFGHSSSESRLRPLCRISKTSPSRPPRLSSSLSHIRRILYKVSHESG